MAFNCEQFKGLITRVLQELNLYSPAAVNLLLGTAAQESRFGTYLQQISGPALGVFQMEPATEIDTWQNFLCYRPKLSNLVARCTLISSSNPEALVWNLAYSVAMARIRYYRSPIALPDADDVESLAVYWKRVYNTLQGKGTAEEFVKNYQQYVK